MVERQVKSPNLAGKRRVLGRRLGYFLAVGLLILAVGWLYNDQLQDASRRHQAEVAGLRGEITRLEHELGRAGLDVDALEPSAGGADCSGGSQYAASVGRFEIALASPNLIIRELDGPYEGGPITQLTIGHCSEEGINVVDAYPTHIAKITGHPAASSADLRASFEANWGSPLTASGTLAIAGETAEVYTGVGLFNSKVLYFDHGGIGFQIELADSNSTSESVLADIVSDWVFTP